MNEMTQKPFENLGAEMAERSTRVYQKTEAVFLAKLNKATGSIAETAKLLGVVEGTVSKGLGDGNVTTVIELAAKGLFNERYGNKKNSFVSAIIQGEASHLKTVKDLVETLGGKFQYIGEM